VIGADRVGNVLAVRVEEEGAGLGVGCGFEQGVEVVAGHGEQAIRLVDQFGGEAPATVAVE